MLQQHDLLGFVRSELFLDRCAGLQSHRAGATPGLLPNIAMDPDLPLIVTLHRGTVEVREELRRLGLPWVYRRVRIMIR